MFSYPSSCSVLSAVHYMPENPTPSTSPPERFPWRCLIIPAVVSAVLFALMLAQGRETFDRVATVSDSGDYVSVAWGLVRDGVVPRNAVRTLGYPLYLAGCYILGGETYGNALAVAVQLLLNLVMVPLAWSFLFSLSRNISRKVAIAAVLCVWYAGLGFATMLLSDFLAGFCFNVFLFGFCFRRTWWWATFAGVCLFIAVLTRPVFCLVFVFCPFLALFVRRFAPAIPWRQVGAYCLFGLAALGVNFVQDRYSEEVVGMRTSIKEYPVMLWNAVLVLHVDGFGEAARDDYVAVIVSRAGRPYETLTRREKEETSRIVFRELIVAHPIPFGVHVVKRFGKSLVAPMDSLVLQIHRLFENGQPLTNAVRFVLSLICLPLWLLAYIPGRRLLKEKTAYLIVFGIITAYVLGITALTAEGCGDRYRLPLIMSIISVAALQIDSMIVARRERRSGSLQRP